MDYSYWEFEFAGEKKFGMAAQSSLVDLLFYYVSGDRREVNLDLRNFRVIKEHKRIFLSSLKYASFRIGMPAKIVEMYNIHVKSIADIAFSLAIKYNLNHSEELLYKIIYNLKNFLLLENLILKEALPIWKIFNSK